MIDHKTAGRALLAQRMQEQLLTCSCAHFTACPSLLTWAFRAPLALLPAPFGCAPAVSMRRSWGSDALLGACWKSCARAMSCRRPNSCFFTLSKACSRRCNSSVAFCTNAHCQAPPSWNTVSKRRLPELPLTACDMQATLRSLLPALISWKGTLLTWRWALGPDGAVLAHARKWRADHLIGPVHLVVWEETMVRIEVHLCVDVWLMHWSDT